MQFHIFKVENLMAEIKSTLANVKEECKQTGPSYSNFLSHVGFNIIGQCSVQSKYKAGSTQRMVHIRDASCVMIRTSCVGKNVSNLS